MCDSIKRKICLLLKKLCQGYLQVISLANFGHPPIDPVSNGMYARISIQSQAYLRNSLTISLLVN